MYRKLSRLIIYRDMSGNSILSRLGGIFEDFDKGGDTPEHLRSRIYVEIRRLLEVATKYGFDNNLWHNYLTFFIITDENPFSLTYEKAGKQEGTVNSFAINDFEVIKELFGEYPVFLFDDVLSELDEKRRKYIFEGVKDRQVIITACDEDKNDIKAEKIINVSGGYYVSSRG